jgi:hypothetical protein
VFYASLTTAIALNGRRAVYDNDWRPTVVSSFVDHIPLDPSGLAYDHRTTSHRRGGRYCGRHTLVQRRLLFLRLFHAFLMTGIALDSRQAVYDNDSGPTVSSSFVGHTRGPLGGGGGREHHRGRGENCGDYGLDARLIYPRGLVRVRQICYLNSFVQALASNAQFVTLMKDAKHCRGHKKPNNCHFCAFAKLMHDLNVVTSQQHLPIAQG